MQVACHIRNDAAFDHLQAALADAGFACERFLTETALMRALRGGSYGLILVDADIDSIDKNNIYSWLNCRTGDSTPVVLLSPTCSDSKMVLALNAGADDLIEQSCDPAVLIARLHAILRRYHAADARRMLQILGFSLDLDTGRLLDGGVEVELTPREFKMAWLLFSSIGHYVSRETISVAIWGVDADIANRTIEQHIYKLRKKLQLGDERGLRIRTAYNKGYRLELCGADAEPEQQATQASSFTPGSSTVMLAA